MSGYSSEGERIDFENVLTVALALPESNPDELNQSMDELERLLSTLGGKVLGRFIQKRARPTASHFIGVGKAEEIAAKAKELCCDLIAFDHEISGTQQKNLEKVMGVRVVDRTGVILEIFQKHARTKESKRQVELASLEYLSTHLTRRWTHLERQKGGIGLKGVGEKQIELDRRQIRTRIARLKKEIEAASRDRAIQRAQRDKFLRVAIVGYTNAGKSTLMNALTHSEVYVDDRVFATLDSTVRVIDPKTRPAILLSDTVGFIDKLPHALVASFKSTLMEVLEADLLLHVVDLSSPHYDSQMRVTKEVLDEIGAKDKPSILVFNKADLLKEYFLPRILERSYIDSSVVSAFNQADVKRLRDNIFSFFERDMVELEVTVPYQDTWLQSQLHEHAKVLKTDYLDGAAKFRVRIMKSTASWLKLSERGLSQVPQE